MLYSLILTDPELSYENHSEDFFIGIFVTRQKAEETACYYLGNLPRFCDYSCTYRIEEKEVVDNSDNAMPVSVWIVQGWNVNDNFDEIDILESECFLTEERAKAELKMMKETSARSEWNIDRLTVGECHWLLPQPIRREVYLHRLCA